MHRKDLFINDSCDWQAVKAIRKRLPQLDVIPAFTYIFHESHEAKRGKGQLRGRETDLGKERTFVIKPVDPIDTCTFVIST